jgi:hypothetical protein
MDQSVASLQTSTNKFFNEQRSARGTAAGYAANAEFYHSSRAVVKTQAVRAAVLERDLGNAYLSELFAKLEAQYDDLELLHKSYNGRGLTTADIDNASRSFDQAFRSIQAYIHALKSNSEATSE